MQLHRMPVRPWEDAGTKAVLNDILDGALRQQQATRACSDCAASFCAPVHVCMHRRADVYH